MKIVLINTSDKKGGAAIACYRLMKALQAIGSDAKMLVRDKQREDQDVISFSCSPFQKLKNFIRFIWERFIIFFNNGFSRKNLFSVSLADTGTNLSGHPLVKEADIIHLHWFNQGALSLKDIRALIKTEKPVVWTLHDMWALTGICHYSGTCAKFKEICNNCYFLRFPSDKDSSYKTFVKKKGLYKKGEIQFVACSNWLKETGKNSSLLSGQKIISIPNPINTKVFRPLDKTACRKMFCLPTEKKIILFGAMKVNDERKGLHYLEHALQLLICEKPFTPDKTEIMIFGAMENNFPGLSGFVIHSMNFIKDTTKLIQLYNAADIYITSSLEDNLPNTIMEALACGVPCIGFNTGGISEMIDHKENGYLADYKSAQDLAKGIAWCLEEADLNKLSENARRKVLENYQEEYIAEKYLALYKELNK
ncbi:MAG: glycosyltransferase family 4 protein [Candidatus Azobacteroides sp.]|nr:glycosyltransferase family 4 protein [Candidatus Azobacteroides sp.]